MHLLILFAKSNQYW